MFILKEIDEDIAQQNFNLKNLFMHGMFAADL